MEQTFAMKNRVVREYNTNFGVFTIVHEPTSDTYFVELEESEVLDENNNPVSGLSYVEAARFMSMTLELY